MKKFLILLICVVALGAGALLGVRLADTGDTSTVDAVQPTPTSLGSVPIPGEHAGPGERADENVAAPAEEPDAVGETVVTVYKSPTCGCCSAWVEHLQAQGFAVEVHDSDEMNRIKREARVPPRLQSCHTAFVGDYVVEGHVPAADIRQLLTDEPAAAGIAVPGMPLGSPGMEVGERRQAYDVLLFQADGSTSVFAHHPGNE